jgi:hypothetical protein
MVIFGGVSFDDGLFPLTPTLSPKERENARQRVRAYRMPGMFERRSAWLPLPWGEGWGEGERTERVLPTLEALLFSNREYELVVIAVFSVGLLSRNNAGLLQRM